MCQNYVQPEVNRETASSKVRLQYFMQFSPAEAHPQFAAPVKFLGGAPLA